MTERVHVTYWLETGADPAQAAEVIAGEQSSGTFVALVHETPELKARSGARIERLEILGTTMANRSEFREAMGHVFGGRLEPVVDVVWPLERAAEAHARLEAGAAFGKIVLLP